MQAKSEFDVFISYSSRDKAWVRGELLERIEQAGLRAFIDFRDFTRGAPSIKEMARGVRDCPKTLLILTPDYIGSEWCELEAIMGQTLSPANRDLRLIPLLKTPCEKPLYVGALTHIDFSDGADLELAWRQLLTALGKPPELTRPKELERSEWFLAHPYPMPPNFTGRVAERAMLTRWLDADDAHPLLVLRALGGFGKSALAWHWLTHDVAPSVWPRVVWWSFYEGDASFDHFLAETLEYLSGGGMKPDKLFAKDPVRTLLQLLHQPGTLLVLDGFERVLRAFGGLDAAYRGDDITKSEVNDRDCLSSLAEDFLRHLAVLPNLRARVLLNTRLCPRVLEAKGGGFLQGCREEELEQMQPADAVEFFRSQGIRGTHTEIETACEPYGFHPLSLRLLAGLIVGDFQQPGDIAAAKRLDVSGDLVQRQHHVLETAYDSLTPTRQALLGRIACFRSPVKYEALKAIAETSSSGREFAHSKGKGSQRGPTLAATEHSSILDKLAARFRTRATTPSLLSSPQDLQADLRDLVARGLLHHDTKEGRFDLHPIVRRFAYDRLGGPDRAATHTRLHDYFAAVPPPDKVMRLEDLAPVIELYHHTVLAGEFDEARTLFRDRLHDVVYYQLGAYQLQIDLLRALFPNGEDHPPPLKDENAQTRTLNELANSYSFSGQPRRATPVYEQAGTLAEKQGDKRGLAIYLGNLAAYGQIPIGALRAAEANLRRSIALGQEIKYDYAEGIGHAELGRLLIYRSRWPESQESLDTSVLLFEKIKAIEYLVIVAASRALRDLFQLRSATHSAFRVPHSTLDSARRVLELADEWARAKYPIERNYVHAHWLLGAAHRVAGLTDEAEHHLQEALERCRRNNTVEVEADILIDLARLRAATGAPDEAQRLADEALVITERSGYVLQGADARLELAKLALARGDKTTALDHAKGARRLATCDGPPDYTYQVAYDEAGGLLAELESHHEGSGGTRSK